MEDHSDIAFLQVNDSVKAAPDKLKLFIVWAVRNVRFEFLVVTRDTSLLALDKISRRLDAVSNSHRFWWASFQHFERPKRVGDFAETGYVAASFPPVPRGFVTVISWDLAEFIARNADSLRSLEETETSLAVWFGGVATARIDEASFVCPGSPDVKQKDFLGCGGLSPNQMKRHWKAYRNFMYQT